MKQIIVLEIEFDAEECEQPIYWDWDDLIGGNEKITIIANSPMLTSADGETFK